MACEGAGSSWM